MARYASARARLFCAGLAAWSRAVIRTTLMCEVAGHVRNRRAVSHPSRRGIIASSVMTSGAMADTFSRQSCPSTAVATSNPSSVRLAAISRRITSSSSTTRTRPSPRLWRVGIALACGAAGAGSDPARAATSVMTATSAGWRSGNTITIGCIGYLLWDSPCFIRVSSLRIISSGAALWLASR